MGKTFNADNIRMLGYLSVKTFGALGNGVTDDRAAIQNCMDTAALLGSDVYFPPGIYIVGRSGGNGWCLTLNRQNNVTLFGIKGASIIRQAAGLPATSIACLRINECQNITIAGLTIDGNWGNPVTAIAAASNGAVLPQATINVESTTVDGQTFPTPGTVTIVTTNGLEAVNYTGITANSFTGCTGGTGALVTGNAVGRSNSLNGLNQSTQADPKNYGLFIRGANNINVDNCIFVQNYGDAIWVGQGGTDFTKYAQNVNITRCTVNITARSGLAAAQKCARIRMEECEIRNTFGQAWDTEPVNIDNGVHDVRVTRSVFGRWWACMDPARQGNAAMTIVGGFSPATNEADAAVGFRVSECQFEGGVYISNARDVVIENCRIVLDWTGDGYAPITVVQTADDIRLVGNYIYHRTSQVGLPTTSIQIAYYAPVANVNMQPKGVLVRDNEVHCRNGNTAIGVAGTGGIEFAGVLKPWFDGVATGIVGTVVTDAPQAWVVDQWRNFQLQMGGAVGTVIASTANTYEVSEWLTPTGKPTLTPVAGAYSLVGGSGVVDIFDNVLDCTNDGNGQGGAGISVSAARCGMRVRLRGNKTLNAATQAIYVDATSRPLPLLEITGNHCYNLMPVPNTSYHILFQGGAASVSNIAKLIIARNSQEGAIGAASGLNTGVWMMEDGVIQRWAGWDSPEGVINAPIGSMFHRRDDGAAAALWVKQNFEGLSVGWAAISQNTQLQWDIDPGSGIGVPATSFQWQSVIDRASLTGIVNPPDALWLCQEAAGSLADSIGAFPLAPSGAGLGYQINVSAWSRMAVGTSDNSSGRWDSTDVALPDVSVAPITMLVYAVSVTQPVPNVNREIFGVGGDVGVLNQQAWIGGAAQTRVVSGPNTASSAATEWGVVRPYVLVHDPVGLVTKGYTDLSITQPAFSAAVTNKRITFGGLQGVLAPPTAHRLYACAWFAALTDAQIREILHVLGWLVQW